MRKRKPKIPPAKLWDRDWKYTPACSTSVADTFARVREQLRKADAEQVKVLAGEIKRRKVA